MPELFSLLVSVAGEIGNNSFDHNLGLWPDTPGVFFGYDLNKKQIVLADRGVGVLKTLKRVRPGLARDADALEVAFTEVISGRAPERQGQWAEVREGGRFREQAEFIFPKRQCSTYHAQ